MRGMEGERETREEGRKGEEERKEGEKARKDNIHETYEHIYLLNKKACGAF